MRKTENMPTAPASTDDTEKSENSDLPIHNARILLHQEIKKLESKFHRKQELSGISSGYAELDAITSGLHPGELIAIAARPSMGKTSLALSIGTNLALDSNVPVLILSLAMSSGKVLQNILC
jgi:replicative DNA helicase